MNSDYRFVADLLPPGTLVYSGPGLIRRRPAATIGLPWKCEPAGPRYDHHEVDRLIATGSSVTIADTTYRPLRLIVAAGLAWLDGVDQPDAALVTYRGAERRVGDRVWRFTPASPGLVTVDVVGDTPRDAGLPDPAADGEVGNAEAVLRDLGVPVRGRWPGRTGRHAATLRVAVEPRTSLLAAYDRFLAGCPDHGGTSCEPVRCRWIAAGSDALVLPEWPTWAPVEVTR